MADRPPEPPPDLGNLPAPKVRAHKRGWPSAVWIVPIIAIAGGALLAVRTYLQKGPTIFVTFDNAEGLEAGKSDVRYKNVPVGTVKDVSLSSDHTHIIATIELTRGASALAVKDSAFWVERPRIGVGGVSGLGTLLSGAYIGVDVGLSKDRAEEFVGLEKPPSVTHDQHGRRFRLAAVDAGSLALRSPVYLHRLAVGQVSAIELAKDGHTVQIEVFVQAPYDALVTEHTVFWNASGLDVSIDAGGLRVDAQSLATVVAGGLAFDVRDPASPGQTAVDGTSFSLYADRATAMTPPDGVRVPARFRFRDTVRGVSAGTAVDFSGIRIGTVDSIEPGYDADKRQFFFDVNASIYPERLGAAYASLSAEGATSGKTGPEMLQSLVGRGLRGQMRNGNLLTGQAFIALAWFPRAEKPTGPISDEHGTWLIPTIPGSAEQIQEQVQDFVAKLDRLPLDEIGANVRDAAGKAGALFGTLDKDVAPEAKKLFAEAQVAMGALREGVQSLRDNVMAPDSGLQSSARAALDQIDRAAYQLRSLSDYIEHHPESLLRGRASGPEPK
ncbi:MAG TPA: MlaD family protein [Kofleriaceae bacterium]